MDPILVDPSDERRILDFRLLGFRDVAVLGRYSYATAHEVLEDHSHGEMLEICFLETGEQTYVVGETPYHLTGGNLFLTFPGECHGTGQMPEGKGKLYWMLLFVPGAHQRFLSLSAAEARCLIGQLLHLPRQFRALPEVKRTLDRIFGVFDRPAAPLRAADLRNLLLRFLLDVLDSAHQREASVSPEMQRVQQFIIEHLDQPLTVRELAREVHLSESRLKSRFKTEIGIPPADFVTRQKIDLAKDLLSNTDTHVSDIAMALGFSTPQYFATVFRRYTGQTPSHFRQAASAGRE